LPLGLGLGLARGGDTWAVADVLAPVQLVDAGQPQRLVAVASRLARRGLVHANHAPDGVAKLDVRTRGDHRHVLRLLRSTVLDGHADGELSARTKTI
jgi:hypothetical protein